MKMDGLYSALQNPAAANKPDTAAQQPVKYRKVLHMVENERMGGKVPVWKTERIDTSADTVKGFEATLTSALNGEDTSVSSAAIALNPAEVADTSIDGKPFSFGDLVDMVNPLHHIPVVNYAYRGITGDQIRPISQIIGGAAYGGPIGAAGGLVNVAIKEETGRDIGEHAMAMAFSGRTASYSNKPAQEEIPASLLAYTAPEQPRTQSLTDQRTEQPAHKNKFKRIQYPDLTLTQNQREPITELLLGSRAKSF